MIQQPTASILNLLSEGTVMAISKPSAFLILRTRAYCMVCINGRFFSSIGKYFQASNFLIYCYPCFLYGCSATSEEPSSVCSPFQEETDCCSFFLTISLLWDMFVYFWYIIVFSHTLRRAFRGMRHFGFGVSYFILNHVAISGDPVHSGVLHQGIWVLTYLHLSTLHADFCSKWHAHHNTVSRVLWACTCKWAIWRNKLLSKRQDGMMEKR